MGRCNKFILVFLLLLTLVCASQAALTWDAALTAGSLIDGSGGWNNTYNNWTSNSGTSLTNWVTSSDAVFGGGTSGTAGTVALYLPVTVNSLTFNAPFAGAYTISNGGVGGNTLTLATSSVTVNSPATISAVVAGSSGLIQTGSATLTLSNTETYTGATTVNGGTLAFTGAMPASTVFNIGVSSGSSYGKITFPSSPSLNGVTINVNPGSGNGYNLNLVTWSGTATGSPTLQINGIGVSSGQWVGNTQITYNSGSGIQLSQAATGSMAATATSVSSMIGLAFGILGVALMLIGAIVVLTTFKSAPIFGGMGGGYRDVGIGGAGDALLMGIGTIVGGAVMLAIGIVMLAPLVGLI